MIIRRASELSLAADFSCSGKFSPVGVVRELSLALSVAIRDLLRYREDPELKSVVTHVLATRVGGRCTIRRSPIQRALADAMAARLALEWKITIPAVGCVRAFFLVTRLEKTSQPDVFDLGLQLASTPSFDAEHVQEVEAPRRASTLLRIF